ncbi:EamA family transporter [Bacillus pacificus]
MHNKKWDLRIICAHVFTILIWGSAFPAIRMGLSSYTPEHLTLLRLLIASFILLLFSFYLQVTNTGFKGYPSNFYIWCFRIYFYHIALNYGEKNSKCWIGKFNRFRHTYSNGNSCFYFFERKK